MAAETLDGVEGSAETQTAAFADASAHRAGTRPQLFARVAQHQRRAIYGLRARPCTGDAQAAALDRGEERLFVKSSSEPGFTLQGKLAAPNDAPLCTSWRMLRGSCASDQR